MKLDVLMTFQSMLEFSIGFDILSLGNFQLLLVKEQHPTAQFTNMFDPTYSHKPADS